MSKATSRAAVTVNHHHHHHQHLNNNLPAKACHNCRRNRLRCDKSLPGCEKCRSKGVSCLGYGTLIRWTSNVTAAAQGSRSASPFTRPASDEEANQGRAVFLSHLDNRSSGSYRSPQTPANHVVSAPFSLVDPAFQDLDTRSRFYISHCKLMRTLSLSLSTPKNHLELAIRLF